MAEVKGQGRACSPLAFTEVCVCVCVFVYRHTIDGLLGDISELKKRKTVERDRQHEEEEH